MLTFLFPFFKNYKKQLCYVALAHFFAGLFTVVSIPTIMLFLKGFFYDKSSNEYSVSPFENYIYTIFSDNLNIEKLDQNQLIILVSILTIAIFLFRNVFRYLAMYSMTPIRTQVVKEIRLSLFKKIQGFSYSQFEPFQSTDLLSRMSQDVTDIEWAIIQANEAIWKAPIVILGSVFIMLTISYQLMLQALFLLSSIGLLIVFLSRYLKRPSVQSQEANSILLKEMEEMLYGFRTMLLFQAQNWHLRRFKQINEKAALAQSKLWKRKDLASPISEFLGICAVVIVLYIGSKSVLDKSLSPEVFIAFIYAFYNIIEPIKSLANGIFSLNRATGAKLRIQKLLSVPIVHDYSYSQLKFKHSIVMDAVSFHYTGSKPVLHNVNLYLKKGVSAAIHGRSAEGKSTLIDILLGLRNPQEGKVCIDGVDLKDYKTEQLRQIFSVVDQNTILYTESVSNNMYYGKDKELGLIPEIEAFVKDIELNFQNNIEPSFVSEKSSNLSGGQRQKVALARALIHGGDVLILDEATSNIDQKTEKEIYSLLEKVKKHRTLLIISHKGALSYLADEHYKLDQGKLQKISSPN